MNPGVLAFLLMFSMISSCIELEIAAPSFPDIMRHMNVPESIVGLTITYNLIGFCVASLIYGPLSECYGRRPVMLVGNGILAIAAILCVIAPSIEWLLFARILQGFGAATSAVVVSAIIADVYETEKAASLYGAMNAVFTTMMALSPIIGGLIAAAYGFRGNYLVVAVICVISWLLLFFFLKETKPDKENISLSKIILDYALLLTSPLFLSAAIIPSLLYGAYMAFVTVAPFLYMQSFKFTILAYTLHQAVVAAGFAIMSYFCGDFAIKWGMIKTVLLGIFMLVIASLVMLFTQKPYIFTGSMTLFCVGSALVSPIIFARSVELFPDLKGTAASSIMSLRYLLCSAITWAVSYMYDGTIFTFAVLTFSLMCVILLLTCYLLYRKALNII